MKAQNDIPSLPLRPDDNFRFGKRPITVAHEFNNWEYLQATSNKVPALFQTNVQGTRQTKFGAGFYRRNQKDIEQPSERAKTSVPKSRSTRHYEHRHASPGYNIINGELISGHKVKQKPSRQYLADKSKQRMKKEGEIALRESMNRFYVDRKESSSRTSTLQREGLIKQKHSSELGTGRNNVPSHGASDALSNSLYLKSFRSLPIPTALQKTPAPVQQQIPTVSKGQWKAPVAKLCRHADEVRNLP